MDRDSMILVRALCEECAEMKTLLRDIALSVSPRGSAGEDLVMQFPEATGDLTLAGGASYLRDTTVNRMLSYLSIDAPEGVLVTVYRDNVPWMFASDEIGAMEFKKGVWFGSLRVDVKNNTQIAQNWSARFIFS